VPAPGLLEMTGRGIRYSRLGQPRNARLADNIDSSSIIMRIHRGSKSHSHYCSTVARRWSPYNRTAPWGAAFSGPRASPTTHSGKRRRAGTISTKELFTTARPSQSLFLYVHTI